VERYRPGTALLVVDVQNDFADPRGSLYVMGGVVVVTIVNRVIERALFENAVVVYTQDWHPAVTPHFRKYGGNWPVHCVKETWGAAFHEGVIVRQGQIVRKGSDGGDGTPASTCWTPHRGGPPPRSCRSSASTESSVW
jgi:nicotinamidase/pyrazinamidase